jgi:hypothetical protein
VRRRDHGARATGDAGARPHRRRNLEGKEVRFGSRPPRSGPRARPQPPAGR